jgi:hypothetical protein
MTLLAVIYNPRDVFAGFHYGIILKKVGGDGRNRTDISGFSGPR